MVIISYKYQVLYPCMGCKQSNLNFKRFIWKVTWMDRWKRLFRACHKNLRVYVLSKRTAAAVEYQEGYPVSASFVQLQVSCT
jgi:hypothetical protein